MSHVHNLHAHSMPSHSNGNHSQGITIRPQNHDGKWVATLSNGETAVERSGKFTVEQGEPTPWVRLVHFLGENDLWITSLRLNYKGRTIHMPRLTFDKFGLESKSPTHYSLQYHLEAIGEFGTVMEQTIFMDLAAHYPDFAVHYIQDLTHANDSWVVVTGPDAKAPTPKAK